MSVFITNKSLNGIIKFENNGNVRLNQFLTTVHSMSKLNLSSQDFYLEFDQDFEYSKGRIVNWIQNLYPHANIHNYRLSTFEQWQAAARSISKDNHLILLQTNFDHPYICECPCFFNSFAESLINFNCNYVGSISHWPEDIARLQFGFVPESKSNIANQIFFQSVCNTTIGTSLISTQLFLDWWKIDFTKGSKIIRPDNPFGPSVTFATVPFLIPKVELFRHMEGYLHVGIKSPWAREFFECCKIEHNQISHDDWTRVNSFNNPRKSRGKNLPAYPVHRENPIVNFSVDVLNLLMVANSHRFNWRVSKMLIGFHHKIAVDRKIYKKYLVKMILNKFILIKLPRLVMDETIGRLILFIVKRANKNSPQKSILVNYIIAYGWIKLPVKLGILVYLKIRTWAKSILKHYR